MRPRTDLPISVIVPTRNEELNLPGCLRSLSRAGEVFVVDSNSSDNTCKIARAFGAKLVNFKYGGGWPKKKNWALQSLPIKYDWVMIVDADERVGAKLWSEIASVISNGDPEVEGYYMRWKFVFLGRWMRFSWRHGWMLRLFRRGKGEYEDLGMRGEGGWDVEVHENIVVKGRTARLKAHLLHKSEKSLSSWLAKQNDFSTWNAFRRRQQMEEPLPPLNSLISRDPLMRRKLLKAVFLRMPLKPLLLFFYLYLIQGGFLDGKEGLLFCSLRAAHELNNCAKVYELNISVGGHG